MGIQIEQLGFDFDGVIADTAEAFIRLICTDYNYCSFISWAVKITEEDILPCR